MTFKRNLRFIGWTLLWAALPLIFFLITLILNHDRIGELKLGKAVQGIGIFSLLISFLTIPGFLLHLKYYLVDKNKTIRFRPTYFEITDRYGIHKIYFKQITKVERHFVNWWQRKLPWSEYGYVKIFLHTAEFYSFNCLTNDTISSIALFQRQNIPIENYEELYPWLSKGSSH